MEAELLRVEVRQLSDRVEILKLAADLIGCSAEERGRLAIDEAYDFLVDELIPHTRAQEAALYPVIGWLLQASEATATLSKDHDAISRMTDELDSLRCLVSANQPFGQVETTELRRILYGLYTLITVHLAKDELFFPLLQTRPCPEDDSHMFQLLVSLQSRC